MPKRIAILGSTGSIGVNTLNVARHLPEEIKVEALAGHSNIDLLEKQAHEFRPSLIAVFDEAKAKELRKRLPSYEVLSGVDGLKAVASHSEVDFVVSAMVGTLGLVPTLEAIEAGKNVGLANKEALVSGGALVIERAKAKGCHILPIDSEHSAIFQCLEGEKQAALRRIILTASGGPFRNHTLEQLSTVTVDAALGHPTWKMGPKITVDCSTLMNKGLEMIEAHWLFGMDPSQIQIVFHPQSIIHSMVEFVDGSMIAQLSEPSMIVPIQYALTYPKRFPSTHPAFDFTKTANLQFSPPDLQKFRCLQLAYNSLKVGGSMPAFMNAANEVLVEAFLAKKLPWLQISTQLEELMQRHTVQKVDSLESILAVDALAREQAAEVLLKS
jgi:1-deoxy-D-xylulose-5-phosphate reductoisomerase